MFRTVSTLSDGVVVCGAVGDVEGPDTNRTVPEKKEGVILYCCFKTLICGARILLQSELAVLLSLKNSNHGKTNTCSTYFLRRRHLRR